METQRIGILYPSNGVYDLEFHRFAPAGASVHLTRWPWPNHDWSRLDALEMMAALASDPQLTACAALFDQIRPAVVTLACTSVSFAAGARGDAAVLAAIRRGTAAKASSTSTAFAAACHGLGAERVAIASVYRENLTQRLVEFLEQEGVRVASHKSDSWSRDPTRMSTVELVEFSISSDAPDAQALLIPETNIATSDAIPVIEERLGKPVLTAVQATVWHAARLAGMADESGIGKIWSAKIR